MRVLDDLEKLKAHYYLEYMDALTDKVEEQRKDIQRKSELHTRRMMKKEKKEVRFIIQWNFFITRSLGP